jgi:hypothetical protein
MNVCNKLVFVPGRPLEPNHMYARKVGWILALPTNIRVAGDASQVQTLKLINNFCKLRTKKVL